MSYGPTAAGRPGALGCVPQILADAAVSQTTSGKAGGLVPYVRTVKTASGATACSAPAPQGAR